MPIKLSGKKKKKRTCESTEGSVLPTTAEPQRALKPSKLMWWSWLGSEGSRTERSACQPRILRSGTLAASQPHCSPGTLLPLLTFPPCPQPPVRLQSRGSEPALLTRGPAAVRLGLASRTAQPWQLGDGWALPWPLFSQAQRDGEQTAGCEVSRLLGRSSCRTWAVWEKWRHQ